MASSLTTPRWTHIAIPCGDIDRSTAFYLAYTPLVVLAERSDDDGRTVWLSHEGQVEAPFVLVLSMVFKDAGRPRPTLAPFAHLGIEVPARADVDAVATRARADGCLVWEPQDMPDPIGYICALHDPDGNVVEISHNQGVYAAVQDRWGQAAGS